MNRNVTCEILSPAGSFECMKTAYHAGADAVYAGGESFGARASAVNFAGEELIEAIDYSHVRGKKFYLTVNTLLKEEELENRLFQYLLPAYEAGVDAVIVQDLGVLSFVRRHFPDLPLHASTQMNTAGPCFARELKEMGVTRIVTARELSLREISDIYQETGLEIESFVHGALCYCYSGQCLLSSMIGGRSGNRGRCAQPCRLAYDVMRGDKCINPPGEKYILSPRDLCTLELLPDILEAGVFSLKIEGRMKKPEYVASVTAMYRKYVDLYLKKGREGYQVEENDIRLLKEIYNRGGFTDGYYKHHNGREMMSLHKPNHCGVKALKLISLNRKVLVLKSLIDLKKGDVLEFDLKTGSCDYTLGEDFPAGRQLTVKNRFQNGVVIKESMLNSTDVFRIRNNALILELTEKYINREQKCPMTGTAELKEGMACLTLKCRGITARAFSHGVSEAFNRPVTADDIREKLEKTGGTEFAFEELKVVCQENLFIPVKELNELRRKAVETLRENMLEPYRRKYKGSSFSDKITCEENASELTISALVSSQEQFVSVVHSDVVGQIYIETALFSYEEMNKMMETAYHHHKKIFMALPYIFRKEAAMEFERYSAFYGDLRVSGFVIRNLEEYFYIRSLYDDNFKKDFIFDNLIYCYNKDACHYLNSLHPLYINFSKELNYIELKKLGIKNGELDIYGYTPVMVTAGCIKKTLNRCDGKTAVGEYNLRDRTGSTLMSVSACRYCYNVIYHSLPQSLLGEISSMDGLHPASLRLNFTFESGEETAEILQIMAQNIACNSIKNREIDSFTKGHFRRGVQ